MQRVFNTLMTTLSMFSFCFIKMPDTLLHSLSFHLICRTNNHSNNHMMTTSFQHCRWFFETMLNRDCMYIDSSFLSSMGFSPTTSNLSHAFVWVSRVCFQFIYNSHLFPERIWSCCYSQSHQSLGLQQLVETSISGSSLPTEPHSNQGPVQTGSDNCQQNWPFWLPSSAKRGASRDGDLGRHYVFLVRMK